MARLKWTKEVEYSTTCQRTGAPALCSDYEEDQFKELVSSNQKGLEEKTLEQAFFFRRTDIFSRVSRQQGRPPLSYLTSPTKTSSAFNPATDGTGKTITDVLNFFNYNKNNKIANLSILDHLMTNENVGAVPRKKIYSRTGWPASSKSNWKRLSNNFRISKIIKKTEEKGQNLEEYETNSTVVFPKSVNRQDGSRNAGQFRNDTIVSFTGIDVSFDGTYRETARSDVLVNIRFTINSFDLLENYYNSDGDLIDETDADPQKHIRFLDLFTPADLSHDNHGILLELFVNGQNAKEAHKTLDSALDSLAYGNYLKLNLFVADHTMTFDEATNKVDINIEYRAAADFNNLNRLSSRHNLLFHSVDKAKIRKMLLNSEFLLGNGCAEPAAEEIQKISKLKKKNFKTHIRKLDSFFMTEGYIKKYPWPLAAGDTLQDFMQTQYDATINDVKVAENLWEANVSQRMQSYHFISLRNLLNEFVPQYHPGINKVLLPFIPHAIKDSDGNQVNYGFYLGDLPIAVEIFEEWFDNKYINENVNYLDTKTFVKDVILNYVNPALSLAFYDDVTKLSLNVSSIDTYGEFDVTLNGGLFVPYVGPDDWGFTSGSKKVQFNQKIPPNDHSRVDGTDFNDQHGKLTNITTVYLEDSLDALVGRLTNLTTTTKKLSAIADNHLVIEGKSPYGPFKSLKISKNNSDYIREIRIEKQGKTDISQLGAVYDVALSTHPNSPDFRFFPGDYVFLYIPDFGLSTDVDNLAYKLGLGGFQIITNVKHKIELEGSAKMTTEVEMRFWNPGVANTHTTDPNTARGTARGCRPMSDWVPVNMNRDDTTGEYLDKADRAWKDPTLSYGASTTPPSGGGSGGGTP